MKNFLINLFGLNLLMKSAYEQGLKDARQRFVLEQKENEDKKILINFPVGTEVILVGNSPAGNGATRGRVVSHERLRENSPLVPIIENEKGHRGPTFAHMMRFDQNRWNTLTKLPWWEQWNCVSSWGPSIDAQTAKNLEAGRPAYLNEDGSEISE